MKNSVVKCVQQRLTTGNSDMAVKTENNYVLGTVTDSVEIPTPNMGFSVMVGAQNITVPHTVSEI